MAAPESRNRLRLADEAARIILEEGIRDYGLAKRKAAERLGTGNPKDLPANTEVADAVLARSRLYRTPTEQHEYQERLRTAALVMERLRALEPRLVGPLLLGILEPQPVINLHGFADTVEEVIIDLRDRGIPSRTGERRYRGPGSGIRVPFLRFRGPEGMEIELTIFPRNGIRQAPPSPIDGRPMRRMDLAGVRTLLASIEENGADQLLR